jgi:hypothetical protein
MVGIWFWRTCVLIFPVRNGLTGTYMAIDTSKLARHLTPAQLAGIKAWFYDEHPRPDLKAMAARIWENGWLESPPETSRVISTN